MHALAMVVEDLEYIRPYVKKLGKRLNEVSSLGSCTWLLSVKCPAFSFFLSFFWSFLLCLLNLNKERGKNSPLSPAYPFQFYCEVDSESMPKPMMEALLSLWLRPPGHTA